MSLAAPEPAQRQRMGFLAGQMAVPDDFDQMGQTEIEGLFGEEL